MCCRRRRWHCLDPPRPASGREDAPAAVGLGPDVLGHPWIIDNIDTYSLEDIEAKLSIICVRNKVNFNLDEDNTETKKPTTFSLDGSLGDDNVPAWVKSLRNVAKSMN